MAVQETVTSTRKLIVIQNHRDPEPRAGSPTIHELIPRVIADLPAIGKSQFNKDQQFHFRGHEDVMNALKPLLARHGVYWVPQVRERIEEKRTTGGGKVMHVVHLRVRFRFYGPAGDYVEAEGWGEGSDMGDKSTNKAMTGACKYVISQVFAVADSSSDADHSTPEETVARVTLPAGFETDEEVVAEHDRITALIKALPDEIDREPFQEYRSGHGWPMARRALEGLERMALDADEALQLRQDVPEREQPTPLENPPEPPVPDKAEQASGSAASKVEPEPAKVIHDTVPNPDYAPGEEPF